MLLPRRIRLSLIACAAAAASAGIQAQPSATPAPAAAAGEEEPGRRWQIPPIAWGGSLAYDLRATRFGGGASSTAHLVTGNLGLNTYIFQPWFARVSGSLGLTSNWTTVSTRGAFEETASLHETIRTREQFATGTGRVEIFPQSRFPFELHFDRNDSRISTELASALAFRTQGIGFSQRYRPVSGIWNAVGSYEHREQSGAALLSKQDTLNGDFSTRWKNNDLSLGGSFSRARSPGTGDDSRFASLVTRHNYVPSRELSINSSANWTRTEERTPGAESDLHVLQWSSVGSLRRDKSPLSLTGSARALVLREDISGTQAESVGASLGANYEFSPKLRLTASGAMNANHNEAGTNTGLTGSVGAAYQGDSHTFAGVRYNWYTSGSAGGSMSSAGEGRDSRQASLNLQLGHTAVREWQLSERSGLSLTASQSIDLSGSRGQADADGRSTDTNASLQNTVSATWQTSANATSAYARTSYSDSMQLEGGDDRFKLFNFQLSGTYEIDSRSSVSGDLTFQRTWQDSGFAFDGDTLVGSRTTTSGASGEVSYRHSRLFGIPQLRFTSRLKLAQDVLKQPGVLLSIPDRETRLWENRLDYAIGRLETQLVLRISEIDGQGHQALFFRVLRHFGN